MKPSSAKAKGRTLQNKVAEMIREALGLPASDVRPAVMGESGCDMKLSARAQAVFPFDDVECKCQEALNIWAALEQSEERGKRPLVVFKRNRSRIYAALPFEDLLALVAGLDKANVKSWKYDDLCRLGYVVPSPLD